MGNPPPPTYTHSQGESGSTDKVIDKRCEIPIVALQTLTLSVYSPDPEADTPSGAEESA